MDDLLMLIQNPRNMEKENPQPAWLPDPCWGSVQALAVVDDFASLPADIDGSWKEWVEHEQPETQPLPQEWKRLSGFRQLMIMRALRPDRMTLAILRWVGDVLGSHFMTAINFDLALSFEDSGPAVPIFFLLSPGVNPDADVKVLGNGLGKTEDEGKFIRVSLGQGQDVVAEKARDQRYIEGGWVPLANIELVAGWLPKLEKKLEALEEGAHPEFRVFLSALPQKCVPVPILQKSIKLTNEPPSGLKANLLRAYLAFDASVWENSSKQAEFKAIVFALCFFHSVVCERRKFGPQGWNRGYPFNQGDLVTCVSVANNYLEASAKIPWADLRYLFGEIMYGGHITDHWDRRLCAAFQSAYVREELVEGIQMYPGFPSPPTIATFKGYLEYIEETIERETPAAYGLHPNAEINFMTAQANDLFGSIADLRRRGHHVDGGARQADARRHPREAARPVRHDGDRGAHRRSHALHLRLPAGGRAHEPAPLRDGPQPARARRRPARRPLDHRAHGGAHGRAHQQPRAGQLGPARLPEFAAARPVAGQPARAAEAAARLDGRPGDAQVHVDLGPLQPAGLPHRRAAGDRAQERVAARQDRLHRRGDQARARGDRGGHARGRVHPRPRRRGRALGHLHRLARGGLHEGALPQAARDAGQGHAERQDRQQGAVRLPVLQDAGARPQLRLRPRAQEQGALLQVGHGRRRAHHVRHRVSRHGGCRGVVPPRRRHTPVPRALESRQRCWRVCPSKALRAGGRTVVGG